MRDQKERERSRTTPEQPWVWLCGHRQDMDEPFVEFLDVFLSLTHIVLFLVFLFFLIF